MDFATFPFGAEDFPALLEPVIDVYRLAFAPPPYEKGEGEVIAFSAMLQTHIQRPGFCGFWASDLHGRMTGFVYGFSGGPGQFWYDTVSSAMPPPLVERWLSDYFELVDLAVCPEQQGKGIGTRLHDEILACTRHSTAALTTAQSETPALRLYRKRGWRTIYDNLLFPGDSKPLRVMAIDLVPKPGE
ncbi:MAG TPA: GNAT family N-acetyltransferase [Anaerolineaceae bacterium]